MARQQLTFIPEGISRKERRILQQHASELLQRDVAIEEVETEDTPVMTFFDRLLRGHAWDLWLPRHRGTGWEFASANPFPVADIPLVDGPVIGLELASGGQPFRFHPWNMYEAGLIPSQNVLVKGGIGRGKSFFMKRLISLLHLWGVVSINISDVKGEHGVVADALGGRTYKVGAFGQNVRVNPLEAGERHFGESNEEHQQRMLSTRQSMLLQIANILNDSAIGLDPEQRAMLNWALDDVIRETNDHPTIRRVVRKLDTPEDVARARGGRFDPGRTKSLLFLFDQLLHGNLSGMFEDEGTVEYDPSVPYTVFDTFAMEKRGDLALAITQAVTNGWTRNVISNKGADRKVLVLREEGWRDMKTLQGLEAHEMELKVSREYGIVLMMAVHEDGDFESVGSAGSEERSLAEKLLRQYSNQIIFNAGHDTLKRAVRTETMSQAEADMVAAFGDTQGLSLFKANQRSYVIDGRITSTAWERQTFDTDRAMRTREDEYEGADA
ncbi:MAG: hypothetical protein ACK5LO_13665 [Leucobacter sp.]